LVSHLTRGRLGPSDRRTPHHRAVFLDRDGTIVQDVGYLTHPSQLELLSGAVEGIRLLQEQFLIVVVSNQSPIARGLLSVDTLHVIHQSLVTTLQSQRALLDAIYACPHRPEDGCSCRKPEPGMLVQASRDLGIDLSSSYMVGDKGSDILAGQRVGVAATVLIPSHQTESPLDPTITPAFVADDLCKASKFILNHQPMHS
jgi:histidinol-phosphate phosphatase family protein